MASSAASAIILWFRRDLRLSDNPALQHALESGRPIVPVYIHDEALEDRPLGGAARWWLDKSLRALAHEMEARGSRLVLRSGDHVAALRSLVEETGAEAVAFNRLYDPGAAGRQAVVRRALPSHVDVVSFCANWLLEPGSLLNGQGGPYKVFTPFYRALRQRFDPPPLQWAPDSLPAPAAWPRSEDVGSWRLHPDAPDWSSGFDWEPGEAGARRRIVDFVDGPLADYPAGRDTPGVEGTTRLSPHLRFGEVAPWRLFIAANEAARRAPGLDSAAEKVATELAWRDFGAHLLHHFPQMPARNMRPEFDAMPWLNDAPGFRAWSRGRTGYPIVDAGMRQLWTTGWMHNRVRMIVASFLVKDLLVDWRRGEAWFWDTLVDADPASNAMNWQWAAGSGVDAAPFFRVFNPVNQGERFDPKGRYVRRWVPELAGLPDRWLHQPWAAPAEVLARAGVTLGRDYPRPVVDHGAARTRALEAFRSLK